jgi:hypothetical protein
LPAAASPGINWGGLAGGGQVLTTTPSSGNPFLLRLRKDLEEANEVYLEALQGRDPSEVGAAYRRLLTAQGRLTAAKRQPNAVFFPSFTKEEAVGDAENPGTQSDTQDYGLLPGKLRRLTFFREYARFGRSGKILRMVDGNVQIRTGQDGQATELKVFVLKSPFMSNYALSKSKASKDPMAFVFEGKVPAKRDPSQSVSAWMFDNSTGNSKSRVRTPMVNIRHEGKFDGVYDGNNIRIARITQEYYEENGRRIIQRVFYREGDKIPIASVVDGDYNGDPSLDLRNAAGPGSTPVFQFVFSGWLPSGKALKSDPAFREALGRFLDAWVTSEAWRKKVAIPFNFGLTSEED